MTNAERKELVANIRAANTLTAREVFLLSELDRRNEVLRALLVEIEADMTLLAGFDKRDLVKVREALGEE